MDIFNMIWLQVMLIIGIYIQSYMFRSDAKRVSSKWKVMIPYAAFVIWQNICIAFELNIPFKLVSQMVIFIIFARLIYESGTMRIALKTLLFTIALLVSEIVVVQFWQLMDISPLVVEYGEDKSILNYSLQIAIYILVFGITFWIERIFHEKDDGFTLEDTIPFLISMASSFVIVECIMFNLNDIENNSYTLVFLICSLLILFAFIYNSSSYAKRLEKRQQEQEEKRALLEVEMQRNYYKQKLKDEERLKSIYHDFKNHLLILEEDAAPEKVQEIKRLRDKISSYEDYRNTGNKYLDIILKEKSAVARQSGIEVIVDTSFDSIDFISSLDISSIFGNLYDYAITACLQTEQAARFIHLKVRVQNHLLIIAMRCNDSGADRGDKPESDFRIKNIERSLQAYEGHHSVTQSGGEWIVTITIPLTDE